MTGFFVFASQMLLPATWLSLFQKVESASISLLISTKYQLVQEKQRQRELMADAFGENRHEP